MREYKLNLYIAALLYLIFAGIGLLIAQFGNVSQNVGFLYGYISIALAIYPAIQIVRQLGLQKSLLSATATLIAPIWFLYMEGLIESETTAYVLEPYLRIKGYAYAMVYMSIFIFTYAWAVKFLYNPSKKFNRNIELIEFNPAALALATMLACLIPLVIIGSSYSSLSELWRALTAGRSDGANGTLLRRGSEGGKEALYLPLMWLWQLTPSLAGLTVVAAFKKGKAFSISVLIALVCGLSVTFFTFLGGSRGMLIFVLAVPIMLWFFFGIKLRYLFWVISIAGFCLAIAVMEFQVKTRGNMLDSLGGSGGEAMSEKTTINPLKSHRDNNLYFLCLVVDRMPGVFAYEGFNDYVALLANPIPRALWPNKPLLSGAKGLNEVKPVYDSGPNKIGTSSLSSSIVGQSFQWYGVLGFLPVIPIYAFLAAWFDAWFLGTKSPNLAQIALQGFAAFMVFWGFRDFFAFVTFIYPFILLYVLFVIAGWFASMSKA